MRSISKNHPASSHHEPDTNPRSNSYATHTYGCMCARTRPENRVGHATAGSFGQTAYNRKRYSWTVPPLFAPTNSPFRHGELTRLHNTNLWYPKKMGERMPKRIIIRSYCRDKHRHKQTRFQHLFFPNRMFHPSTCVANGVRWDGSATSRRFIYNWNIKMQLWTLIGPARVPHLALIIN